MADWGYTKLRQAGSYLGYLAGQVGSYLGQLVGQQHGDKVGDNVFLNMDHTRNNTATRYSVSIIYTRMESLQGLLFVFGGKHGDWLAHLKHWGLRFKCRDHDVVIDFGADPPGEGVTGSKPYEGQNDYNLFDVTIEPATLQKVLDRMKSSGDWEYYCAYSHNCHHFVATMVQTIHQFSQDGLCVIESCTEKANELMAFDLDSVNIFAIFGSSSVKSS
ncbi:hypothetical protein BGZ58_004239 [Dissophora ornata]|nr:hypothetical protein BGZ58_004239 [Dissophora ornata]